MRLSRRSFTGLLSATAAGIIFGLPKVVTRPFVGNLKDFTLPNFLEILRVDAFNTSGRAGWVHVYTIQDDQPWLTYDRALDFLLQPNGCLVWSSAPNRGLTSRRSFRVICSSPDVSVVVVGRVPDGITSVNI